MKRSVIIVGGIFAVALAVVIGNRMSADAMAVVVGVMCGVLASVPTSLLLVWALGRRGQGAVTGADGSGQGGMGSHYPPIVVVNSGAGVPGYGPPLNLAHSPGSPSLPGGPRSFKVVGDEETAFDELRHIFSGLAEDWVNAP